MIYLGIYLVIGIMITLSFFTHAAKYGEIDFNRVRWTRVVIFTLFWPLVLLYFSITD